MEIDDLEIAEFEATCPTCKLIQYPRIVQRHKAVLHIPPRYALICTSCRTPWYMVNNDAQG